MLSETAVRDYFSGWDLNDNERRYLAYHSRRFAYVLRVAADCVRRCDGRPVCILDVGPHFLTALLGHCFPDATLNTLGFPNPRCYEADRVGRHLQYDLNESQFPHGRPEFERHDVVVMSEVIEHLYTAPELVLDYLKGLMKPGGFLVVQTPNAVAWNKRLVMLRGANPFEMIRQSRENPGHFREYTADELRRVGEKAGLVPVVCHLENYFNAQLSFAAKIASGVRKGFRQGITFVYRRPAEELRQSA